MSASWTSRIFSTGRNGFHPNPNNGNGSSYFSGGRRYYGRNAFGDSKKSRFTPDVIALSAVPIITFALGTWQVQRLQWKLNLIDEMDDKLSRPPLEFPEKINLDVIPNFAYRKVHVNGVWDHSKEMLVGPRKYEGQLGYYLYTPLQRPNGEKVLVNRGFITKSHRDTETRPASLATNPTELVGMLRTQTERNYFSPPNNPEKGEWLFVDIGQMANWANAQPVLIDQINDGDVLEDSRRRSAGLPIGRAATVELRNMHATYAVTWYSLSAFTTFLLWRLLRRPSPRRF